MKKEEESDEISSFWRNQDLGFVNKRVLRLDFLKRLVLAEETGIWADGFRGKRDVGFVRRMEMMLDFWQRLIFDGILR